MGSWGSWAFLDFSGLRSLCSVVSVARARLALVHGLANVVPVGEVMSVGLGATIMV